MIPCATGVQDLAGVGAGGEDRVVAERSGVAVGGALLLLAVHLADRRVQTIVTALEPGPAPKAQARRIVSAIAASSWRMWPNANERRNVPSVDGAITRNGSTC